MSERAQRAWGRVFEGVIEMIGLDQAIIILYEAIRDHKDVLITAHPELAEALKNVEEHYHRITS